MQQNNVVPFCNKPWREIHFYNRGDVGTCCREPVGTHNLGRVSDDPRSVWFGKKFERLRRLILEGNKEEAGCSQCVDLSLGVVNDCFEEPNSAGLSDTANFNYRWALDSHYVKVQHYPLRVFFQLSYLCNMACPHCSQTRQRLTDPEVLKPFPIERFKKIYKAFFKSALSWVFVGGEVLVNRNFYKLLEVMDPNENPSCALNIVTNGQLLDKAILKLRRFPKVQLHISVDAASRKTYKAVRGGDWDRLVRNLRLFLSYGKERGLDWSVIVNNLLMKSNIHEVPEMVKFAYREGVEASFGLIYGCFKDENIFVYPELLEGIEWLEAINKGEKLLHTPDRADLWVVNALLTLEGVKHYLSHPFVEALSLPDYQALRLWHKKVCELNDCSYKPSYSVGKAFSLLREGKLGYLIKRVVGQ